VVGVGQLTDHRGRYTVAGANWKSWCWNAKCWALTLIIPAEFSQVVELNKRAWLIRYQPPAHPTFAEVRPVDLRQTRSFHRALTGRLFERLEAITTATNPD
jgi:hypothetical protein